MTLRAAATDSTDPVIEQRRANLMSRLHTRLDEEDLKMSDLPIDDNDLVTTLGDLGFVGLERTQLRKALKKRLFNSTEDLSSTIHQEKKTKTDSEGAVKSLSQSANTAVFSTPPPTKESLQSSSENPKKSSLTDEELARALQEEEYNAVELTNSSENGGGYNEFINEFLEQHGQTPGGEVSGVVIRRTVPGDHSCLFSAIAYVAEGPQAVSPAKASALREVCAQDVLKDPEPAKRALLLGVNNVNEYAAWIRNPEHWGGENEIIVLAKHYSLELAVVSTQSLRIISYGSENTNCSKRAYLLYTGSHYDPLVVAPSENSAAANERRTFPKGDRAYDALAIEAARKHLEQPQITLNINLPTDMTGTGKKDKSAPFVPVNVTGVTFDDVKGCEEAKDEVKEVVLYLKDPDRFTRLGAKLPRGILMTGSPGTGKTLMARAVAGEAKASFIQCTGSEFDEEYVGVGARRVRQLFEAARNNTPCIVFMDELDAVGGKRNSRDASYHRQTLNQLLAELDGFKQNTGIVLMAATNFPQALDPALTRPGRIDKTIHIPLPDLRGRHQILQLHSKNVTLEDGVDLSIVAKRTTGMSGADLANLINIAAIRASAEQLPYVPMLYLEEAYDRVAVGATRRSPMSTEEKNTTAYHEGGHTLVSIKTFGTDPVHKATILPRGTALGITWSVRDDEKYSEKLYELQAQLDMMMGGRAAEELAFGKNNVSAGCSSDLRGATNLARQMVMNFGMGGEAGELSMYYEPSDYQMLSDQHKNVLDSRIQVLLQNAYKRASEVLQRNQIELHMLAGALMEYETLDAEEIRWAIAGKKEEIQKRHDQFKAKLANYSAMAIAAQRATKTVQNNTNDSTDSDLEAAIALSLSKDVGEIGVQNRTSQGANPALSVMEPLRDCIDTFICSICAFVFFLLALSWLAQVHRIRRPLQALQEPLLDT